MDPRTGEIVEVAGSKEAKRAGLVAIPRRKVETLRAKSPEERIAWAANRKKVQAARKTRRKAARKANKQRRR